MRINAQGLIPLSLIMIASLFCTAVLGAQTEIQPKTQAQQQNHFQNSKMSTCPAPNVLFRDGKKMVWGAPGGWHSYYRSFVKKIARFTGAHWVGVDVGKVICTYQGQNKLTFTLFVENKQYVAKPNKGRWLKEVNGVINCLSPNINQCPFTVVQKDNMPLTVESLMKIKTQQQMNKMNNVKRPY